MILISSTGIGAVVDYISKTGTRTVLGSSVSTKLLLGLYHVSRTDTGAVMDSIVSVGLVMGQ